MKLYHGTSEAVAKLALKEGLKPRGKRKGNWKHTVDSRRDAVYLTDVYGGHFALQATKDGERAAVIEIDVDFLDKSKLIPDEDFLEQGTRAFDNRRAGKTMLERTRYYRKLAAPMGYANPELWKKSLEHLGTVSYRGVIPPEAFTRIAFIDTDTAKWYTFAACDGQVSILNHKFCSGKYRELTKWLFEGEGNASTICMGWEFSGEMPEQFRKMVDANRKEMQNREGILVTYVTSGEDGYGKESTATLSTV